MGPHTSPGASRFRGDTGDTWCKLPGDAGAGFKVKTTRADPATMQPAGKHLPLAANWPEQDGGGIPPGSATIALPNTARSTRSASTGNPSTRRPGGVRRPDSPLHRFFPETSDVFSISAVIGYTGYRPAMDCENVIGRTDQKVSEVAKIITDVRKVAGQGAGQNPWGAQLHRPRIVGHTGWVPQKIAGNVHGLTFNKENEIAQKIRDRCANDLEIKNSYYCKGMPPPFGYNAHKNPHYFCGERGLAEGPARVGRWK